MGAMPIIRRPVNLLAISIWTTETAKWSRDTAATTTVWDLPFNSARSGFWAPSFLIPPRSAHVVSHAAHQLDIQDPTCFARKTGHRRIGTIPQRSNRPMATAIFTIQPRCFQPAAVALHPGLAECRATQRPLRPRHRSSRRAQGAASRRNRDGKTRGACSRASRRTALASARAGPWRHPQGKTGGALAGAARGPFKPSGSASTGACTCEWTRLW